MHLLRPERLLGSGSHPVVCPHSSLQHGPANAQDRRRQGAAGALGCTEVAALQVRATFWSVGGTEQPRGGEGLHVELPCPALTALEAARGDYWEGWQAGRSSRLCPEPEQLVC